jgi:DNA-binding CsgD family transcriptional regulator
VIAPPAHETAHARELRELSADSLWSEVARSADRLGCSHWNYTAAPTCYADGTLGRALRVTTYPERHVERCFERDLFAASPAIGYAVRTRAPARFAAVTAATPPSRQLSAFCALAREHGVSRGIVIPLDNVLGVRGSLSLVIDGSDRELTDLCAVLEPIEAESRRLHGLLQARHAAAFARGMLPRLTPRKRELLRGLVEGHSTAELADDLGVSVSTIDKHVAELKRVLRARTTPQMAALAVQYQLLDEAPGAPIRRRPAQGRSTSRL